MPLEIGNIVTVLLEDSTYCDCQGQVVEIKDDGDEDGPIGVRFGREYNHLFDFFQTGDSITVRFLEAELRKDLEWNLEVRLFRAFGSSVCNFLMERTVPFDPKNECQAELCSEDCARRCLINIWGTVYEIDLCETCAKLFDGKWGESWPNKRSQAAA